VDPAPDPLLLRKSGSAGNRIRDLRICTLDHIGGQTCQMHTLIEEEVIGFRKMLKRVAVPPGDTGRHSSPCMRRLPGTGYGKGVGGVIAD
jgi:hypothetical protein